MAPFNDPQPQALHIPLLPRQAAASQRIVTLTITRGTTVYTSTIALGSETEIPVQQSPLTVPNSETTPTPTAAFINPVGEDSGNRGVVAGAVIGSVLGFLFLCWFLWRCRPYYGFGNGNSSRVSYRSYSSDSYYSAPPMRHRGGGGCEWERKNWIRYPDRTWIREGCRDESYDRRGSEGRSVGIDGWTRPRRSRRGAEGCLTAWLVGGRSRGRQSQSWARDRRRRCGSWVRDRRERSRSWSWPRDRKRRGSDAWNETKWGKCRPGTIDD
jgi:hypothetical protein